MSNYDVALVLDAGTLNTGMTQLYANPTAQKTLFAGTEPIGELGITTVDWAIAAAPQFVLTPPTTAQWTDKNIFTPSGTTLPPAPTDQMFQVTLSVLKTTINMQQGAPVLLTFTLAVFAEVSIAGELVVLGTVAVLPVNVEPAQELYLQIVCSIAYTKVAALLAGYKIPSTIPVAGHDFTPPAMTIAGGYLAIASTLTTSAPLDIAGVDWPQQPLGVLLGRQLLTALVNQYSTAIVQKMDAKTINYSDSNWAGSYAIAGGITDAAIALASQLPNISVTATVAATANVGVSWWLVPGACALEAASNLL